ncbi:MAG: carboxypeptidase regulatory-like domain-containing protein [Eggerthellaceae bacterium]|nr:carboxypeptidase regulatory-like domain-containing protein [Eggerthellaceae bacterium]
MKVFVFDAARCNGCCGCQIVCKDEHCGNDWMPYAKPQPMTGHFWCKVDQVVHGQAPVVKIEYTPRMCNHCDNAPCIAAAPDAVYKREDGLVIIDPEKAAGHAELVDACPYGAIYFNEELSLPQKCTGCAHLVDAGELPRCVDYCATGALRFGDEEDFADEIAQAEVLGDPALGPRVYYLNRPHLFLAGNVWDPDANENIEGAVVTLLDAEGAILSKQETDDFGDFNFKRIDAGGYRLRIEAEGFKTAEREVDLQESLYVGDFPLQR